MPGPPPEQLRRAARWPSRFAPRLIELHSPPPDPDADLAEVADLSDIARDAGGRITGATMSARAFVSLAGRCPTLTRVRLIGAAMILGEVVASPPFSRLESLSLTGCRVGDRGAELIAQSAGRFAALDLAHNALTGAALRSLAGRVPNLEFLNLAGNFLEPADWLILSDSGAFPRLRRLLR